MQDIAAKESGARSNNLKVRRISEDAKEMSQNDYHRVRKDCRPKRTGMSSQGQLTRAAAVRAVSKLFENALMVMYPLAAERREQMSCR